MDPASLKQVRAAALFANLTDAQLDCIAPGEVIEVPPGTILVSDGDRYPFFLVVLEGELRITRYYDNQEILMAVVKPGLYTGELTLLLDIPWPSTVRVGKPARLFRLGQDDFYRMLGHCPLLARTLLQSAAGKMRNLEGFSQQREKLASLGTMAAGLAHELNNPAAAAQRAAAHLQDTTGKLQTFLCSLSKALNSDHWQILVPASEEASAKIAQAPKLEHLERSDREDSLAKWLAKRSVPMPWDLAPTFVSAGVDIPWLEGLLAKLPPSSHAGALGWLEARLNLKLLLNQIEQSTGRIAELVKAVKSYSYMDQSPMQEIDIHEGIESTLTMLGHKLKNVTLNRAFDRSIPHIMAYGSELNQVWTNLIDNAVDAVNGTGKICVGTCREDNQLVVEIVDNGPGIPPNVQAHMFEPFYTTKAIGSGTGLGLIISNRIVADRHGGEIEFESKPGETRFKVRLPLDRKEPHGNPANMPAK
ncbi:MAG: ATP-binding protein [Verrucomicrobiota bacterium]|jgi:signal transduction histidine kinase